MTSPGHKELTKPDSWMVWVMPISDSPSLPTDGHQNGDFPGNEWTHSDDDASKERSNASRQFMVVLCDCLYHPIKSISNTVKLMNACFQTLHLHIAGLFQFKTLNYQYRKVNILKMRWIKSHFSLHMANAYNYKTFLCWIRALNGAIFFKNKKKYS